MILYHMSNTLAEGKELTPDYKKNSTLVEPFVKALDISVEMFRILILNAGYFGSVLEKYNLSGMPAHEIKWGTEGIFEYVRRKEFPGQIGRIRCNYFYPDLQLCGELYYEDWGQAPEEERAKIRLYEAEVEGRTAAYDMRLFDEAFDILCEGTTAADIERCMELAGKYFRGEKSASPIMEILSDGTAVIKRELDKNILVKQPGQE